jgi:hypothetical protein
MAKRIDAFILEMALIGYEAQRQKIEEKIAEIRKQLGRDRTTPGPSVSEAKPTRRDLSPAARRRIAAAQKKRWAEFRKQKTRKTAAK